MISNLLMLVKNNTIKRYKGKKALFFPYPVASKAIGKRKGFLI